MPTYESIYRLELKNFEGEDVLIHISDTTSGTSLPPTYHDLTPGDIEVRIVSDTDSKYGIKSKRVLFSFFPDSTTNVNTFLEGADDRWLVEMFVAGQVKHIGYLVVDDLREAFLDDDVIVVQMTAADGLGLLKDLPLLNLDGTVPKGPMKIIDLLSIAFKGTQLQLPINVIWNLFPEQLTTNANHTFGFVYVDAIMFETDINKRESLYEVIRKLCPHCVVTQEDGAWWIMRVDEMEGGAYEYYQFDADGIYIGPATITLSKDIGLLDSINPINKDGEISPDRKKKSTEISHRFDLPREILCNIDFTRGALIGIISIPGGGAYTIECWTAGKNYVGTPAAATVTPYIRRMFTNGYEVERIVVIPQTGSGPNWIKAERIKVNTLDKFNFSVDRKLTGGIGGASGTYRDAVAHIRLYGSNGTYWTLTGQQSGNEAPGDWIQTNSTFSTNNRVIEYVWNASGTDETKWAGVNVEAKPVPIGGEIEVYLLQSAYGDTRDTHFQNLNFNYIPIIDGVYQRLTGETFKVSTSENLRAKVEEQQYIFDSFNPNFKGSMFYLSSGNYLLTTRWYDFRLGTGGALGLEKFGKYQAFELWNQNNRVIRMFEGSLSGIDSATQVPGLLQQYTLTANSDHSNNKIFEVLSYSQSMKTTNWGSSVFSDVFDSVIGKDYAGTFEHKYSSQ